jgi:hypothetical protein
MTELEKAKAYQQFFKYMAQRLQALNKEAVGDLPHEEQLVLENKLQALMSFTTPGSKRVQ